MRCYSCKGGGRSIEPENQLHGSLLKRFSDDIPDTEWQWFLTQLQRQKLGKNDYFIRSGEHARSIAFCVEGLFRFYYDSEQGKEVNKSFCGRGEFVAAFSALLLKVPSSLHIQALEDSDLLIVSYDVFVSLYERHICWERLKNRLVEKLFIKKEQREKELLLCSAEQRYHIFVEEYPELHERIPQYHIASYLGITPVALSRIRRRMNLG
ncbi:Crp/Fnr family transcriptional regulator [Paenibacillus eucommiae]|uniref:CRP-like cAMP-binding protein n=1 Tax=Paenibacillus eucommiae TaxID=1355755 RepID=A0ABS4J057_9BACL|nr:Crp/Fnr family transcriptional regulator [Paenibacillus eucommiae]MBP1993222.1 CRP-like cAMP-binding protein [Paenibacillus eucommiae]